MTTKPRPDTPRTPWASGSVVPGDSWVYVTPGARELFNDTALVPGWRRIVTEGPDPDGDFTLYGIDNPSTYQFVRAVYCDVDAEKHARPTVSDWVRIYAPEERHHGKVGKIVEDDGSVLPYFVRFERDDAEWFYSHQVTPAPAPEETAPDTALVSISHTTIVTLQRPVTADQISRALALLPLDWFTTLHTHDDRIEIIGTDMGPRG